MKLIDISRPIFTGMPVWPGDTPAQFDFAATKSGGYSCNVGRLRVSMHTGTHVDAPYHFDDAGLKIDEIPVDLYVGPARVVDVRGRATITPEMFASLDLAATPRVLLRSDAWTNLAEFPTTWPQYAPGLATWLAERGVRLIGMDFPSVDHLTSKDLPIHHEFGRAGVFILESLDLCGVEAGVYELIALPLRVRGADGCPVRAVLRARD
ncbi:MAG: arylformamidase [Opitutus sp.]|nr:arylformamidase [Opitutus sp.]